MNSSRCRISHSVRCISFSYARSGGGLIATCTLPRPRKTFQHPAGDAIHGIRPRNSKYVPLHSDKRRLRDVIVRRNEGGGQPVAVHLPSSKRSRPRGRWRAPRSPFQGQSELAMKFSTPSAPTLRRPLRPRWRRRRPVTIQFVHVPVRLEAGSRNAEGGMCPGGTPARRRHGSAA